MGAGDVAGADTVLLTGLPRSGTTLACELLNRVPDAVALDEPIRDVRELRDEPRGREFAQSDPLTADVCGGIATFVDEVRESLLVSGTAPSKQVNGEVVGRNVSDDADSVGLRRALHRLGDVRFEKPLSPRFVLVVKQPGAFTALLPALLDGFRVYAIVRNPLSVLSSWQTVRLPVYEGRLPIAEDLDRPLGRDLDRIEDRVDRQLHLLSWFFERYETLLPRSSVIRYEDVIASRGRALSVVTEGAASLDETLESRNRAPVYDREVMRRLAEPLLQTDGAQWSFYSKDSVRELIEGL